MLRLEDQFNSVFRDAERSISQIKHYCYQKDVFAGFKIVNEHTDLTAFNQIYSQVILSYLCCIAP